MRIPIYAKIVVKYDSIAVLRPIHLRCLNLYRLAQSIKHIVSGLDVFGILPVICCQDACCCTNCHSITLRYALRFNWYAVWLSGVHVSWVTRWVIPYPWHLFLNPINNLSRGVMGRQGILPYSCLLRFIFFLKIKIKSQKYPRHPRHRPESLTGGGFQPTRLCITHRVSITHPWHF